MFASTLTAALSTGQRASVGPTDLGLLASPQLTTRSHSCGTSVTVRPAGPNDAEMLQTYVRELSASARYNRFLAPVRELPPVELARATEMNGPSRGTLIAEIVSLRPVIVGELRYAVLSSAACEFAISVADNWRRKGLGTLLLNRLQCGVRPLGVETLVGDCPADKRGDAGIRARCRIRHRCAILRSANRTDCEEYLRSTRRSIS
jgi:GNAT superfamily N-acetyltransferase